MTMKFRVHFDGRVLVPEEPVDLPVGESVEIRVRLAANEHVAAPGMPSAVLAAALSEPHISSEHVAELERNIAESKLPLGNGIDFDCASE
jgi:predicted DNA-binding antitoxin AbrB/MazE fold protein